MLKTESKCIGCITIIDPDTNSPCDIEIRKTEGGILIGLDAAYLEQLDGDRVCDNPRNPYDKGVIIVPDDEDGPVSILKVVNHGIEIVPYDDGFNSHKVQPGE